MPHQTLAEALLQSGLAELTTKQRRILGLVVELSALLEFTNEEVEASVHSSLRFMYYLSLLESGQEGAEIAYRRWTVRSMYREEELGISTVIGHSMDGSIPVLEEYAGNLPPGDLKYGICYDLARYLFGQLRVARALVFFRKCQEINPARCKPDMFALPSNRARPSVDEYVAACEAILQPAEVDVADTPTGLFGGLSISQSEPCIDAISAAGFQGPELAWLLQDPELKPTEIKPVQEQTTLTMAEAEARAQDVLKLEGAHGHAPAVALARAAHAYLAGLRQLEHGRHAQAQWWFERGQQVLAEPTEAPATGPVMAQSAEKDRQLRVTLQGQLEAHMDLASVLKALAEGQNADSLATLVERVLERQTAIRFEFLEAVVLACVRQDSRAVFTNLVATLGTNQKLYQQLPDVHLAVLQVASLLLVVRDALAELHVDLAEIVDSEGALDGLDAAAIERLSKAVGDIASTVQRIPLAQGAVEGEIERFCRLWADPLPMAFLGTVLAECAVDAEADRVQLPWTLSILARRVAECASVSFEQPQRGARHLRAVAHAVLQEARKSLAACTAPVLLALASTASGQKPSESVGLVLEAICRLTHFDPEAVEALAVQPWFVDGLVSDLARALRQMGCGGAAAVLLQLQGAEASLQAVSAAFESGEIDQRVAGFFWDPSVVEYAEYLARQPTAKVSVKFAVPGEMLEGARPLLLAECFAWLAANTESAGSN
ncbi:hypothetical protein GGI07_005615 [Coemansia sp. Benny D115]|nr:hypothetical protein GGI07_005615 [Coemansia sp. Benny D115]